MLQAKVICETKVNVYERALNKALAELGGRVDHVDTHQSTASTPGYGFINKYTAVIFYHADMPAVEEE